MKKIISITLSAILIFASIDANAQHSEFTLNNRAWSTNYFATMFYGVAAKIVKSTVFNRIPLAEEDLGERLLPEPSLVFPIALSKRAPLPIYGVYHRAFKSPFKHLGDYGIGVDASYRKSLLGVYAGAYFKSQEIVFKGSKDNLRGYYIQPRVGFIVGADEFSSTSFEVGVFYDAVAGCGGSVANKSKDRLQSGFGLDFALTIKDIKRNSTIVQFSMPLHSFLNKKYEGQQGCNRKVGYFMLTERIIF